MKIQLLHPQGKRAFKIDAAKYQPIENAILICLKKKPLTHTELTENVKALFAKKKIAFEGSIEWYLESVKLHLEAVHQLERVKEGGKLLFKLK